MGIMASQITVNQPFTRRMKTGSPCTDAQRPFATPIVSDPSSS